MGLGSLAHGVLPMSRILVRSTNWIGDVVMSLAAFRELRRLHPSAHLAVLARPWVAAMYQDQGLVDEIRILERSSSNPLDLLEAARGLRDFDTSILFPNSFGAAFSSDMCLSTLSSSSWLKL